MKPFVLSGILFCSTLCFGAQATSPIIIELFTSQGCSSCPPAENLLDFLNERYRKDILPLAFHVDYWDDSGWKDPFSNPDATQRQRLYRDAFHDSDLYTPEMVVQGEVGFVGSDRKRAEKEIRARLESPRPVFTLEIQKGPPQKAVFSLPKDIALQSRTINVILFENTPSVMVQRGENTGRLMNGDFTVRKIITLANISGSDFQVPFELQPNWVTSKTGLVVVVHGGARQILAAQTLYPLEGTDASGM
jgi:hypothetical protein